MTSHRTYIPGPDPVWCYLFVKNEPSRHILVHIWRDASIVKILGGMGIIHESAPRVINRVDNITQYEVLRAICYNNRCLVTLRTYCNNYDDDIPSSYEHMITLRPKQVQERFYDNGLILP